MNDFPSTRSLLSLRKLSAEHVDELITLCQTASGSEGQFGCPLHNKYVGLLFLCPSTRTRSSFWRGATDLGAQIISFGREDLQITTGESFSDTGRVLGNFLDAIVFRNNSSLADYEDLEKYVPVVINAMNDSEHPSQGIADLIAIYEHFGYFEGLRLAYFGPGNNIPNTLALLFSRLPKVVLSFYCPPCNPINERIISTAKEQAAERGGRVTVYDRVPPDIERADIVYTTRWRSMGKSPTQKNWRIFFKPFTVNEDLFKKVAIPGKTVFMHDLPAARGEEVSSSIIDSEESIVWRQARHKLTSAKVCLAWCFGFAGTDGLQGKGGQYP